MQSAPDSPANGAPDDVKDDAASDDSSEPDCGDCDARSPLEADGGDTVFTTSVFSPSSDSNERGGPDGRRYSRTVGGASGGASSDYKEFSPPSTAEHVRLADSEGRHADWKAWGPYVSERAWGTVREDYSADGDAWNFFPHEHAASRAYRWNEDGIAGICNRHQNLCMSLAFWNEKDPILKERFFGVTGSQGNHGEDVKEYYFYTDSTPTHSYMKMVYKYPMDEYPYADLVKESQRRSRHDPEYELYEALKDGWDRNHYFDIQIEYAKATDTDILCRITAVNRSTDRTAPLHIIPQAWFRNTWSWGYPDAKVMPFLRKTGPMSIAGHERHIGDWYWYGGTPATNGTRDFVPPNDMLFTHNNTNKKKLFGTTNESSFVKDAFHERICSCRTEAVNPDFNGTKAAFWFHRTLAPQETFVVCVRLRSKPMALPFVDFDAIMGLRLAEADEFYAAVQEQSQTADDLNIQRQAFAGLLWSKQYYHYGVSMWIDGDPVEPRPPLSRKFGRNRQWRHLYNSSVISMPDKWEYPWYATWDLAFHCVALAMVDQEWAKRQLILMTREWFMHPSGQLPAYEWNFNDVNPPVHAWAAFRVYQISRKLTGVADTIFLEKIFHKLLLNFTWWVNRKDSGGNNLFEGGFLGLDNIGVFDRSKHALPKGMVLEQADGTAWMGMYCLNMLDIALELARYNIAYEDVATKFFEHFVAIANSIGESEIGLWDSQSQFFYDVLRDAETGRKQFLRARSFVGLIPLFAVTTLDEDLLNALPNFKARMEWFMKYRPEQVGRLVTMQTPHQRKGLRSSASHSSSGRRMLSLVSREQLTPILHRLLDETQFLAPHGLRSLSKEHKRSPVVFDSGSYHAVLSYEPAESSLPMYGGNSNWRGPIWMPVNFLMIESLQRYDFYFGDTLTIEFPTGSGKLMSLWDVSQELSNRLANLFRRQSDGRRPVNGGVSYFSLDPHWANYIPFYEYFHGDNGAGIGASHQTGWTALIAKLMQQLASHRVRMAMLQESGARPPTVPVMVPATVPSTETPASS